MAINILELFATLSMDTSQFLASVRTAQQSAQQMSQNIGNSVNATNTNITQSSNTTNQRVFNSYREYQSAVMSLAHQYMQQQNVTLSEGQRLARAALGAYQKNVKEQLKDIEERFNKSFENIGKFAEKTFSAVSKATAVGLAAAATGVGAMIKQATSAYGEYEQLVGGVETLFKDNAEEVVKNSQIAYQSAQMSANEYMNTVTSFSASLLQGLGGDTKKATEIADKAIIDMADKMLVRLKRVELYQRCGAKRQQEMVA